MSEEMKSVEEMTDEELRSQISDSNEPVDEPIQEEQVEGQQVDGPDGNEGQPLDDGNGEADLNGRIAALEAQLQEQEEKATHWRQVSSRHADDVHKFRQMRERLLQEQQARQQADPMQVIENPAQYRQDILDEFRGEQQIRELEQREQQAQRAAAVQQNGMILRQNCPDLVENMDGITEMLKEAGDTPDAIAAFKRNPAMFDPQRVVAINYAYRQKKAYEELRKRHEADQGKAERVLDKVEKATKRKPTTAAASSARTNNKGLPELSDTDIVNLSDEKLKELLKKMA